MVLVMDSLQKFCPQVDRWHRQADKDLKWQFRLQNKDLKWPSTVKWQSTVKWPEMASASQSDIDMSSEPSALAVSD